MKRPIDPTARALAVEEFWRRLREALDDTRDQFRRVADELNQAEARNRALVEALRMGCSGCKSGLPLTPGGAHKTAASFFLCKLRPEQRAALTEPPPPQEERNA